MTEVQRRNRRAYLLTQIEYLDIGLRLFVDPQDENYASLTQELKHWRAELAELDPALEIDEIPL